MRLLTLGNPKTAKGVARKYLTAVLHLAAHKLSGYNVCFHATDGCSAGCLAFAGRAGIFAGVSTLALSGAELRDAVMSGVITNRIQAARIRRTHLFFQERDTFFRDLTWDIRAVIRKAKREGLTPAIRLNGTSDLPWERIRASESGETIIDMFPATQFYDYTKVPNRVNLPSNYHLTFSLAENNDINAHAALANGMNVAAVFRKNMPETFMGVPVINGDETDLRFLDPAGVIVGLKAKGKAKLDRTGFVRDV